VKKQIKKHIKHFQGLQLLYDRNLQRKTNKKQVKSLTRFWMIKIFKQIKKHMSPISVSINKLWHWYVLQKL